jgi:iron complex outermembrane receptor protein
MTHRNARLTLLAASVAGVLAQAQAYANPAEPAASSELGEIVVTARQREERITDVPVTVQAFTSAEIQNAGIERPTDFIALTPGVSQVQTAEAGDLQVSIRGINTGRDAEANFALVVDGVLQTNPQSLNQELAGVTQIEVLKGPQSAVYGRNAVAGAMIITTRKPGDEFEGDVGAGVGNYGLKKANVWLGGPVTEGVKISASAYWRETDGQWENITLGCDDCVDYFEEKGGSLRGLFDVAGGTLDFKAKFSKISSGAINFNGSTALKEISNVINAPPFYEDPNDHVFTYTNNVKPENEQENMNFSLKGEWDVGIGTLTAYAAYNDQTNYFLTDGTSAAFQLYFPVGPNNGQPAMAACQASYVSSRANVPLTPPFNYGTALGNSFLPPYDPTTCSGYQYQQRDQKDTSVEIRLASRGDQALRWLGGLYYGDIDRRVVVAQGADLNRGFLAQAFVPTSGPNPTDLLYDDDLTSRVTAAFGQLAYDVAPGLEVALALRYDEEKREVDNNVPTCTGTAQSGPCRAQTPGFAFGSNPFINPAYTATPSLAVNGIPNREKTFSQWQPKLSVNWKLSDDFSTFASYGYGFRSGGFNSTGSAATISSAYGGLCLGQSQFLTTPAPGLYPPACTPSSTFNIRDVNDEYRKEVSKSAELGFKSFLADRSVQLNGAIFYTKVDDMQFFSFFAGPFGLLRVVTNMDEVTLKGAELDARWKINQTFTVFAAGSYVDGNIDEYAGRPYTKGNEVPYAPKYTGAAGVDVTVPVGSGDLAIVGRVDATFVGETWFHPVQDETVPNLFGYFGFGQGTFDKMKRDAYATFNARVGLQADNWGVTVWGRNLSDKEYLAEIIPAPEFGGGFIHDAPGRTYGLDLTYRF